MWFISEVIDDEGCTNYIKFRKEEKYLLINQLIEHHRIKLYILYIYKVILWLINYFSFSENKWAVGLHTSAGIYCFLVNEV